MRKYSVIYFNYEKNENETKIVQAEKRSHVMEQFKNNKPYTIKKIIE